MGEEEIVHVPEVVTQEQIVKVEKELIVHVPRPQIHEKIVQVPKQHITEKIVKKPKLIKHITDNVVHNQVQTIEVEKPRIVHKTVTRKRPVVQEKITHVPKMVEEHVTVQKIVQKTIEVPQIQYVDRRFKNTCRCHKFSISMKSKTFLCTKKFACLMCRRSRRPLRFHKSRMLIRSWMCPC